MLGEILASELKNMSRDFELPTVTFSQVEPRGEVCSYSHAHSCRPGLQAVLKFI